MSIVLAPSTKGRRVGVFIGERTHQLEFSGSGVLKDKYRGDGLTMTVDPEILINDENGRVAGPCL